MEGTKTTCDQCGVEKREVNHWIKAVVHPAFEGIMFIPAESATRQRSPDAVYEDLCGQECAHKRLSAWLDDLKNIDFPGKGRTE